MQKFLFAVKMEKNSVIQSTYEQRSILLSPVRRSLIYSFHIYHHSHEWHVYIVSQLQWSNGFSHLKKNNCF